MTLSDQIQKAGKIPFAYGTSDFRVTNDWWYSMALNAYLGADELKKVLKGESPWDSELVKEATKTYVDMWQKGYINDKASHAITLDDAWGLFSNGETAMKMEGSWALNQVVNEVSGFEVDYFIMPSWREGVKTILPTGLGDTFAVNSKTKYPDLAAEFLNLLYSTDTASKYATIGKFFPLNDLDLSNAINVDPIVKDVLSTMNEYLSRGDTGYVAWTYFSPKAYSYIWNNLESVFLGQLSVDEYLKSVQQHALEDKNKQMLFNFND